MLSPANAREVVLIASEGATCEADERAALSYGADGRQRQSGILHESHLPPNIADVLFWTVSQSTKAYRCLFDGEFSSQQ